MSTTQEDYRACQAVVAKGAADLARAEAFRRKARDLSKAVWLRPADIAELTGLSGSTVYTMLTATGDARMPSVQYKGKGGRKGVRLVKRTDFDAFMARHAVKDTEATS